MNERNCYTFDLPEGHKCAEATCPIFTRKNFANPKHIGTGVLLRIHQLVFLLTAGHVADALDSETVLIGMDGKLLPLNGLPISTIIEPGKSRELDPLDIAVIPWSIFMELMISVVPLLA